MDTLSSLMERRAISELSLLSGLESEGVTVSQITLQRWINGSAIPRAPKTYGAIARVLDVTTDEVIALFPGGRVDA